MDQSFVLWVQLTLIGYGVEREKSLCWHEFLSVSEYGDSIYRKKVQIQRINLGATVGKESDLFCCCYVIEHAPEIKVFKWWRFPFGYVESEVPV